MPVLNWIGKEKVVNHDKELPFKVLKPVKGSKNSENLLIEGDNLEALKSLMPFYYQKVKFVYIDPPYNTGSEKWVYNDKVNSPQIKSWLHKVVGGEGEDLCRHDKWLCMMYPRLKLIYDLLSNNGVVVISIDDNEIHNLKAIASEIFGEKNIDIVIWKKIDPKFDRNANAKIVRTTKRVHEYLLIAYKDKSNTLFEKIKKLPNWLNKYSNPDNDPRGPYKQGIVSFEEGHANENKTSSNYYSILTPSGRKITRQFFITEEEFKNLRTDNRIYFPRGGAGIPALKIFENEEKDFYFETILEGLGSLNSAKKELALIFEVSEKKVPFDTPKPTKLVKELIRSIADKNDIILDSFAGSGTTGHAVLELNKEDGGNRKFILIELDKEIAKKITKKRLERVIEGYEGSIFPKGTGQSFQYLELNGQLYREDGFINPEAMYEDLAGYIYFTETKNYLDLSLINNPYIGSFGLTNYFLLYKEKGANILDEKTFRGTEKYSGDKIIYADKCLLDEEFLDKNKVTFKQIPYELKKY